MSVGGGVECDGRFFQGLFNDLAASLGSQSLKDVPNTYASNDRRPMRWRPLRRPHYSSGHGDS